MRKKLPALILITVILSVSMCINVSASSNQYTYTIEDKTIIFEQNTIFEEKTREHVANYLAHKKNTATTYGLACTLFGHSYESSLVTTITHCVYDTDPRCLKETYEVQVCTRCDDTITNRIAYYDISCCPEE